MGAKIDVGDVVVISVRGKPRLAWYVQEIPGGHVVRDKADDAESSRIVTTLSRVEPQPS